MIVAIANTHSVIWHLFSDSRLGKLASAFIDATIGNGDGDQVGASAITIAEMILAEQHRMEDCRF